MESVKKYKEFDKLDLPKVDQEILAFWKEQNIFEKSISSRSDDKPFVFYEGPPSANGKPGIHHVMARTIKDLFCRYKTLKGYQVNRKGGWDTHGLPIELSVEKSLGITKEDIGTKISVEEYNATCRKEVLKYKDLWDDITQKMGYWLDLENPYVTYENDYIESIWHILKTLYDKDFLYKGYTIQPFSPAAGTGLSTHELNQPGTYRNVKDTSVTAQFKIIDKEDTYFLAWTTTPWTLPSNTALAVGPKIEYVLVKSYNQYTFKKVNLILAKALVAKQFSGKYFEVETEAELTYNEGDKKIPYFVADAYVGKDLVGLKYEQLLPFAQPYENPEQAFRVIPGNFVTTEDGTGIVHIAPTFGADDAMVAKEAGVPAMLVLDDREKPVPLVDFQGKFRPEMGEFAGKYVKNEYYTADSAPDKSIDVELAIRLKEENKAFKVEKYEHSYPHCWRTDKPILYYPLDSWFVRATAAKERMYELNKTINWKPASTGEGRFGKWLENLQDWNLSRSRFWGTPLPIWRTADGTEEICIGSIAELQAEVKKSVAAGFMDAPLSDDFDLHKPYVDNVVLVSASGQQMKRESDLIDVWFDSGAMPYAQWHYPFENKDIFEKNYPADFIAEGVDQTRGWFYTLHAISVMLFDKVSYKNVVSNGLVLDKDAIKMSKRLNNFVDPFETIITYGADATRWYMISNSQPWDNLKFDLAGLQETQRKFFGTLYNTYSFFALYANIDGFDRNAPAIPLAERPEIDRWVVSKLHSLIEEVDKQYGDYEPTRATRAIQDFVGENLSNWYVRLCRKRFWQPAAEADQKDKQSAYQTLHECLLVVSQLMSPVAPFFSDSLFRDLQNTEAGSDLSVHLSEFPKVDTELIDKELEERMYLAQQFSSLVLSLRKKEKIKVRQPLKRILIPVLNADFQKQVEAIGNLVKTEVNIKEIEFVDNTSGIFTKNIKPNFKELGKKAGKHMKQIQQALNGFDQAQISQIEQQGSYSLDLDGEAFELTLSDVLIDTEDMPGWLVNSANGLTVALDTTIDEDLRKEGIAREIVNKLQRLRKDSDFKVTDKIKVDILENSNLRDAIDTHKRYICNETLTGELSFVNELTNSIDLDINGETLKVMVQLV